MTENVDDKALQDSIERKTALIAPSDNAYYISVSELVRSILSQLLLPNIELDEAATEAARNAAYRDAMNNPVMIEKGYRIVNVGEVVTDQDYTVLKDLNLLNSDGFDYPLLLGIILYMVILFTVLALYLSHNKMAFLSNPKDFIAISVSFMIPIISAVYLKDISPLISTVYFSSVIVSTYLGIDSGIILGVIQVLIISPINNFEVEYIFVSVIGVFVSSVIAGRRSKNSIPHH